MVKRVAEFQILKDCIQGEDENESSSTASPEVLAKRKILKPRGRNVVLRTAQSLLDTNDPEPTLKSKLIALNNQFLESVSRSIHSNVLDLRPLIEKYTEYYSLVKNASFESRVKQVISDSTKHEVNDARKDASQGWVPSNQVVPSTEALFKNSVFKLNNETQHSQTAREGPKFKFNKKISDPVFKLDVPGKPEIDQHVKSKVEADDVSLGPSSVPIQSPLKIDSGIEQPHPQNKSLPSGGSDPNSGISPESSAKANTPVTGEEDEAILFTCKSKIFLYNSGNKEEPYKNAGLGELKVLKSTEGRSRILVRAEGSWRVILNTYLVPQIDYLADATNVKVPVVNTDGSLQLYLIKVKTPHLAKELSQILTIEKGS